MKKKVLNCKKKKKKVYIMYIETFTCGLWILDPTLCMSVCVCGGGMEWRDGRDHALNQFESFL